MKKIKWQSILGIAIVAFVNYIIGFLLNCFVSGQFHFCIDFKLLIESKTFIYMAVIDSVSLVIFLSYIYKHQATQRARKTIKGKTDNIIGNLENSHFQTESELNRNFKCYALETLPVANAGIPIKAEEKNGTIQVYITKPAHTLAIGTTGSGKTTAYIDPTIQILSRTKDKPSMIINDCKGELYARHANSLKGRGYDVQVIDLRNPFNSIRWNPLEQVFKLHEQAKTSDNAEAQVLEDKAYDILHDIAICLSPITSKDDPIWERGAKNFLLGSMLALLNDEHMTKEQYNFYNLYRLANLKERTLHAYFNTCKNIQSKNLASQVLNSSDKTKASYMSTIADKVSIFSDTSVCALTSENELDLNNFVLKPTALFLQIPDEKQGRYKIASLFLSQTYKNLVNFANENSNKKLSRPIYFIIDEYGNLPAIPNIEQMITVGRSRNIWFLLVIQSYTQLYNIYGQHNADTIRSNCNVQIFIGSNDEKTTTEFSRLCGNYTVDAMSVGVNPKDKDLSSHLSLKERPLIYPSELAKLNNGKDIGNAIVSVFGYEPIKSKFTPSFKTKLYRLIPANQKLVPSRYFDPKKYEFTFNPDVKIAQPSKVDIEDIKEQILSLDCLQDDSKVYILNLLEKEIYSRAISMLQATLDYATDKQAECVRNIIDYISSL